MLKPDDLTQHLFLRREGEKWLANRGEREFHLITLILSTTRHCRRGPRWGAAERADQCALLAERCERVGRGLRGLAGCDAHRVDADDALAVCADFWATETAGGERA